MFNIHLYQSKKTPGRDDFLPKPNQALELTFPTSHQRQMRVFHSPNRPKIILMFSDYVKCDIKI